MAKLRIAGLPRRSLTQAAVGRALGVRVATISSWEHGRVPQAQFLDLYARVFAVDQPANGHQLRVPATGQMSAGELARFQGIRSALLALRDGAEPAPNPLLFPPGEAITIVCSELPSSLRSRLPNSDALDPDFVESYKYADLDALIELLPFVQRQNHESTVKVGTTRRFRRRPGRSADHLRAVAHRLRRRIGARRGCRALPAHP